MRFGIVADDNTGASDAAGMLTERGVKTALVLGLEQMRESGTPPGEFGAVVLGTQTRAMPAGKARARTAAAVEELLELGAGKVQLKYCSTFDSTPEGNIGPSLDAGLDTIEQDATTVTPALPVNGRTTYCGYHFVNGVPLSESPLRHHPLNPMTDSNLVRWLQQQTERKVDLLPLGDVRQGADHARRVMDGLVSDGASYLVTDAVEQSDLTVIAEATADWPFISGGSGITAEIPSLMFPERTPLDFAGRIQGLREGGLVVSGSVSPATLRQNAYAASHGFRSVAVDATSLLRGEADLGRIADTAEEFLEGGDAVIVHSGAASAEDVQEAQEFGRGLGLSVTETGDRVAEALAEVAARLVERRLVGRLIISGGETSGAVCRGVGFGAFEVGLPLEPGVPYCFPAAHPKLMVVLKSGNFGSEDFYLRVMNLK